MNRTSKRMAPLLATLAIAGCAASGAPEGKVAFRAALTDRSLVDRIRLQVEPAGISVDLQYDSASGTFLGTITVPRGPQTFTATAYRGATAVGSGSTTATVVGGSTIAVTIWIIDSTGPDPEPPMGPVITSLMVGKTTFELNEVIDLAVTAVDPDGDALSFQWSATCAAGTFSAPTSATTTFSSSAEGACTLTVTVTAGSLSDARVFSVAVVRPASGAVNIDGYYVPIPTITAVTVIPLGFGGEYVEGCSIPRAGADATCRLVPYPNQLLQVMADVQRHDNSPAPYTVATFTDDCGGTFSSVKREVNYPFRYYYEWRLPAVSGICRLAAHADVAGAQDTFTVGVVSAGCVDDDYEQNDSAATPAGLRASVGPGYAGPSALTTGLYAHDDDYYGIPVSTTVSAPMLRVTANALSLEIFDSVGGALLGSGTGVVDVTPALGQSNPVIHVSPGAGAATCSAPYELLVEVH